MSTPDYSIIIPACDEARYLPACLAAIDEARDRLGRPVEVVVCDNGSRDETAALARAAGARVVEEPRKCLSAVRNRGAAAAQAARLVFVDADTCMDPRLLEAVHAVMESGRYVGGGVLNVRTDRYSLGIALHFAALLPVALAEGISCTLFYTTREAFDAIGGFDESLYALEDVDFARRLKRMGKQRRQRYKNLLRAGVVTSARKFDEFGDWFVFRHPIKVWRAFRNDRATADEIWYRPRR